MCWIVKLRSFPIVLYKPFTFEDPCLRLTTNKFSVSELLACFTCIVETYHYLIMVKVLLLALVQLWVTIFIHLLFA